jgi:hypothetical protein
MLVQGGVGTHNLAVGLSPLKQKAAELWEVLNEVDGTNPAPDQFHHDMRQYGKLDGKADLRCRATWERACIAMEATSMLKSFENTDLVLYLHRPDTAFGIAYRDQILEAVLAHKTGLLQIKNGLERLYCQPVEASDRQNAIEFFSYLAQTHEVADALPSLALAG